MFPQWTPPRPFRSIRQWTIHVGVCWTSFSPRSCVFFANRMSSGRSPRSSRSSTHLLLLWMSSNGLWCTVPYSYFWKISASIRSMRDTTSAIFSPINPTLPSLCICCWNFSSTCHRWPSTIMLMFVFNSTRNPRATIDARTIVPV